jgi:hypothetical protein
MGIADSSDRPAHASQVNGSTMQRSNSLVVLSDATAVLSMSAGASTAAIDASSPGGTTTATISLPTTRHATMVNSFATTDEFGNSPGSLAATGSCNMAGKVPPNAKWATLIPKNAAKNR